MAATAGAPLLMVKPEPPVPSETTAALAALDPDRIVILGGPLAVSDEVTRGHTCNSTGNWDLAVDITAEGALVDSDFSVMFSGSENVYP